MDHEVMGDATNNTTADAAIADMIALLASTVERVEACTQSVGRCVDLLSRESGAYAPQLLRALAAAQERLKAPIDSGRSAASRYRERLDALETAVWIHTPAGRKD